MLSANERRLLKILMIVLLVSLFAILCMLRIERIKQATVTNRSYIESLNKLATDTASEADLEARAELLRERRSRLSGLDGTNTTPAAAALLIRTSLSKQGVVPKVYKLGGTRPDEYAEFSFAAPPLAFFKFLQALVLDDQKVTVVLITAKYNARAENLEVTLKVKP